jgi:LPS export ABC transporter protein LptC
LLAVTLLEPPVLTPEATPAAASDQPIPQNYATSVVVRDFSTTGELVGETSAAGLRRYAYGSFTELDEPQRRGHDGDSDWVVTARSGILRERLETLALNGDVVLRYLGESVEFSTESLRMNFRNSTAQSEAGVLITQNGTSTRADQLFANLDQQRAKLTGSVKTVYVPQ